MGSIALIRLTLHNFRSFQGVHVLDFPKSGLIILRGDNRDTRGGSGAGKTNVLLALAYIFGYCNIGSADLQCWFDDKPMYVEIELDTPEGVVVVRRGIKGLSVGALKGKSAEAKLDQIIGVPADLREILTYRDQVEPKKFLGMRDGALKEFLIEVLKLHGLEKEIKAAFNLLDELAKKRDTASIRLFNTKEEHERRKQELEPFYPEDTADLEGELGRLHVAVDRMRMDLEIQANELAAVEAEEKVRAHNLATTHFDQATAFESELQALRSQAVSSQDRTHVAALQEQLEKCEGFLKQLGDANQTANEAYDRETQALRLQARQLHNELARVPGLVDNITVLKAQIEKLASNLCDRCERQWPSAQLEMARQQRQLETYEASLLEARTHKEKVAELDAQIAGRRFEPDPRVEKLRTVRVNLKAQIGAVEQQLKGEAMRAATDRARAEAQLQAQIRACNAQGQATMQAYLLDPSLPSKQLRGGQEALRTSLGESEKKVAQLSSDLALVRQANRSGLAQHDTQVKQLAESEKRLAAVQVEHDAADIAWKVQSDYVDMLVGFRNKIFDEVLEAIGADASAIIATLPNSQHISIEFQSERETKTGTVQEKITPIVSLYGVPRKLKAAVSGGQGTSIGLAVDLAVAGVISRRLGCHLNWIVLDESFNGHDPITKQACLEMLQTYAHDKLVIIVDHMTEIKEMFTKDIVVTFENKLSSLKVAA